MLGGMTALAAWGMAYAAGDVRGAIVFAAVAAAAIDIVAGVTTRFAGAADRRLAAETIGGAATAVLDALLQFSEGAGPLTEEQPELSLRHIAAGRRLYTRLSDPASMMRRVRNRLFDYRQLYAATAGTQVALLDERARRVAVDAQRELDAAIIALDRLGEVQWRHGVLYNVGARGRPLKAYDEADLVPRSDRFHELAASAAVLLTWLERPRGRPLRRQKVAEVDRRADERARAARALVAREVEDVIRGGGRVGGWLEWSSLSTTREPTLDDVAALDDLTFRGQAVRNGWGSFNSGLREDARQLGSVIDMLVADLPKEDLAAARTFREQLDEASKLASRAGDAEGAEVDAHAKQLPSHDGAAAAQIYEGRRQAFLVGLRAALKTAHAIIDHRPPGFAEPIPTI